MEARLLIYWYSLLLYLGDLNKEDRRGTWQENRGSNSALFYLMGLVTLMLSGEIGDQKYGKLRGESLEHNRSFFKQNKNE